MIILDPDQKKIIGMASNSTSFKSVKEDFNNESEQMLNLHRSTFLRLFTPDVNPVDLCLMGTGEEAPVKPKPTLSPAKTSPGSGQEGTSRKNVIVTKRNKKRNNILGKVKTA